MNVTKVLVGLLAIAHGIMAENANLLVNPQFEVNVGQAVPHGWHYYDTGLPAPACVRLADGRTALEFKDFRKDAGSGLYQNLSCVKGETYELSCEALVSPKSTEALLAGVMMQLDRKNYPLHAGTNRVRFVASGEKTRLYLWTVKKGVGQGRIVSPSLRRVENAVASSHHADGGQLLENPDFLSDNGVPRGWFRYSTLPPPRRIRLADGTFAIEVIDQDSKQGSGVYQNVQAVSGERFVLSCDAFCHPEGTEEELQGVMIQLRQGKDTSVRRLRPGHNAVEFQVPEAAGYIQVYVCVLQASQGKGLIKNLRLRKVNVSSSGRSPAPEQDGIRFVPTNGAGQFFIKAPGIYQIDAMVTSPRHPSSYSHVRLSIDGHPWTRAILRNYNPMRRSTAFLLFHEFSVGQHSIRFDFQLDPLLGAKIQLHEFQVYPFRQRVVPDAAKAWVPPVVPPSTRPRILVTQRTLPMVRKRLTMEPNKTIWERLQRVAQEEMSLPASSDSALGYHGKVCSLVRAKFFVYLLTGNRSTALSGKDLLLTYLRRLDFVRDMFYVRWYGEIMYSTAVAYDWGYEIFTEEERRFLRERMNFFAHTQEVGYPPFGQDITIGHGNERQIHMDLMAYAVATYDSDPTLYQYCTYRLLGILVPERIKEFESGRHAEGAAYGQFRLIYDLYSALNFKLLNHGQDVFHPNIKEVFWHWLYARNSQKQLLPDGDCWNASVNLHCVALAAIYSQNPWLYGFLKKSGDSVPNVEPEMMLAWFDPTVKPQTDFRHLPLTRYQQGVLSSMNCRTGWDDSLLSNDALIEFNAKEYNLSSHSHRDIGSFQIDYRGFLAGDIGQYRFFGVPYDKGFNKRTVAHSAMLIYRPDEHMKDGNDGGQKSGRIFSQREDFDRPDARYAQTLAAAFGPDERRPVYNFLKTDMTNAYPPGRLTKHIRSFYFLNESQSDFPGFVVVADRVDSPYQKYFQVNTLGKVSERGNGIVTVESSLKHGFEGFLHIACGIPEVLRPRVLRGKDVYDVFGKTYRPPVEGVAATRIMFPVPSENQSSVCVMQISGRPSPVETKASTQNGVTVLTLGSWTLALSESGETIREPFALKTDGGKVLLADLAAGDWSIEGRGYRPVSRGKHHFFAMLPKGRYHVRPGKSGALLPEETIQASLARGPRNQVLVDGKVLPGVLPVTWQHKVWIPLDQVSKILKTDGDLSEMPFGTQGKQKLVQVETCAIFLGCSGAGDIASNVAIFNTGRTMPPVIFVDSSNGKSAEGLFNHGERWSHNSKNGFFTIRFLRKKRIKGFDVAMHSSAVPLRIEESSDGKTWRLLKKVVTQSGKMQTTKVRFDKAETVDFVRFSFGGSLDNPYWNTVNGIDIIY